MKKLSILILALGLSLGTFAQPRNGKTNLSPEERAEKMTERMADKLELTDDQKNGCL
jgi:protein CpxP